MELLRKVVKVKNHHIEIKLPDDFGSDEAEVIVLPVVQKNEKSKKKKFKPKEFFGSISKETAMKMLKYVEESRKEWERGF